MSDGRSDGAGQETARLAVLGTLVLDTIRGPDPGEAVEAPGGIAYSLAALEAVRPAGWGVVPVLKVGEDAREVAEDILDRLETVVSREGVRLVAEPNNRVELTYDAGGGRTERLTGGVPGWTPEELAPVLDGCDALYVNLIAGWEVDLGCARGLRGTVPGPVYCDLHSLFLDGSGGGVRRRRAPEAWCDWLRCFDYVQLNEEELATLADDAGEEPWSLATRLPGGDGPRVLFVTLGRDGAAWTGEEEGRPEGRAGEAGARGPSGRRIGRAAPPRRVEGGDPTGCGDVWGAACFGVLLGGAGPAAAVDRANELAARNAARRGGLGLLAPDGGRPAGAARREGHGDDREPGVAGPDSGDQGGR